MTHFQSPRTAGLLAAVLVAASLLAGCADFSCSPREVPTQLSLALADEEARTLPILSSGATQVAGEDIPDAHGRLAVKLRIAHEGESNASLHFTGVEVLALRLTVKVGDAEVPTKLVQVEGGTGWHEAGEDSYDGRLVNGSELTLWWVVDRTEIETPLGIVLPEGAPYTATVDFDWRYSSCIAHAAGHLSQPFSDFVEASVNAKTFQPAGQPVLEVSATGVGIRANYTIASGLDADVSAIRARAVFLGEGTTVGVGATGSTTGQVGGTLGVGADVNASAKVTLPSAGLVVFPAVKWGVNGAASSHVTPRDVLAAYSASATSRDYATSGAMLPSTLAAGRGVYVVLVDITYTPGDPTLGVTTDAFAYAVQV